MCHNTNKNTHVISSMCIIMYVCALTMQNIIIYSELVCVIKRETSVTMQPIKSVLVSSRDIIIIIVTVWL